ncbi:MAG: SOS response-associated peptidase [Myxococcaceae bacterium]|nr:SOS response-associated peptidase [Myxococcaceae bacterium]
MCGRFTLKTSPKALQEELGILVPSELAPRFNIAPSQRIAVVTNTAANTGERKVELFKWGLIPSWAKDPKIGNRMINARAETLVEKPSYRTALKKRRCVILADGFYEWRAEGKKKLPLHIRLKSQKPFAMAGLWEIWKDPNGELVPSCTIITTGANDFMSRIHDRMPVIIPKDRLNEWLAPDPKEVQDLLPLLQPWAGDDLEAYPVSPLVNSPSNEGPECAQPAPEQASLAS